MGAKGRILLSPLYHIKTESFAHTTSMREDLKKPLLEAVRILGITLAVYLAMRYLLPLVIPFLIAFFIAKQLHPWIEKLHKRLKLKRGLISAVVLLLLFALLLWVLWMTAESLIGQIKNLIANAPAYQKKVTVFWESSCAQVEAWTGMRAGTIQLRIDESVPEIWDNMKGTWLPGLMSSSFSWVKGIGILVAVCVVVGVSTLLMTKEYANIRHKMDQGALGRTVVHIFGRVYHAGGGYVKAQLLIMLAVTGVCVIGLFFTGNPYAMLAGMGIGLCDALPFLGTGTVFIPWALLEILSGRYMLAAVYVIIYTIASLTRELLEPKLVGNKLGIHPLVVVISIYAGINIYGLWGFALGPVSYILIREIWQELR